LPLLHVVLRAVAAICTSRRAPDVALSRVFKSYDVYGPSVSRPGRKIVYGNPEFSTHSSPFLFHFSTPNAFKTTNGITFVLKTPTLDTKTNRFKFGANFFVASTTFRAPT
jgi:hypothetical protein